VLKKSVSATLFSDPFLILANLLAPCSSSQSGDEGAREAATISATQRESARAAIRLHRHASAMQEAEAKQQHLQHLIAVTSKHTAEG
jgi:hypothetical protein